MYNKPYIFYVYSSFSTPLLNELLAASYIIRLPYKWLRCKSVDYSLHGFIYYDRCMKIAWNDNTNFSGMCLCFLYKFEHCCSEFPVYDHVLLWRWYYVLYDVCNSVNHRQTSGLAMFVFGRFWIKRHKYAHIQLTSNNHMVKQCQSSPLIV